MRARKVVCAAVVMLGAAAVTAFAHDDGRYANAPQDVRDWYRNAQLTEAAQRRFGFKSCCNNSDVVRTKFQVGKTDGADQWFWLDGDQWRQVPPDIIHWEESAPDGQPTLFALGREPTCFFPGRSGQ